MDPDTTNPSTGGDEEATPVVDDAVAPAMDTPSMDTPAEDEAQSEAPTIDEGM